jgi:hypothetical protein
MSSRPKTNSRFSTRDAVLEIMERLFEWVSTRIDE